MCTKSNPPHVSALGLTPMHWFLQEDYEGLVKFEGDGKLAEDQAVRFTANSIICLLYTSPSPRDGLLSRMPSSA